MRIKPKKLRASQAIHTPLQKVPLQGLVAFFPSFTEETAIGEKSFASVTMLSICISPSFAQGLFLQITTTELRLPSSHDPF